MSVPGSPTLHSAGNCHDAHAGPHARILGPMSRTAVMMDRHSGSRSYVKPYTSVYYMCTNRCSRTSSVFNSGADRPRGPKRTRQALHSFMNIL